MADTPLVIDMKAGRPDQTFAPDITRANELPGGVAPTTQDAPELAPAPLVMAQATPPADAGVDYLVQRAQSDSDALLERARARYGVQAAAPSPAGAAAAPAPVAGGPSLPAATTQGEPPALAPPALGVDDVSPSTLGGAIDPAKVARGVGRELVRTPRAVAAGVAAAGRELFEGVDSLATWLNDNVADLRVPIGKTGSETVDAFLANPAAAIAGSLPEITTPDTVTGPIVKEVAQFLAGMVGGGKLLKGAGVALKGGKAGLAHGAIADALFFDPKEENLSAFLKKVPDLANPVTDFLATSPDDNEALNRLRRSVEGLGLGLVTEGLIAGVRAYRAQRAALKAEESPAKAALAQQEVKYGKLTDEELSKVVGGDAGSDAPIVTIADRKATEIVAVADSKIGEMADAFLDPINQQLRDLGSLTDIVEAWKRDPEKLYAKLEAAEKSVMAAENELARRFGKTRRTLHEVDEAALTVKERDFLFYSDLPASTEQLREIRKQLSAVSSLDEAAQEIAFELKRLPRDLDKLSDGDKLVVMRLQALFHQVDELDGKLPDVLKSAFEKYGARWHDAGDATDMVAMALDDLKRLFDAEAAPKAIPGPATESTINPAKMVTDVEDVTLQAKVAAEPKPSAGDLPNGRIAINWARISTGDDIKVAMRDMADAFKEQITAARRGTITADETAKLADNLGMTVDDLLARREGQALNAEETLAARRLLTMASEKLVEAARAAAAPNAGAVDLFAFRRMVATHAAIQNEVMAARAEAGRALAAWKIPATAAGDVERSRAIAEALSAAGGDQMARDFARRMAVLADSGAPESAIAKVAQRGWGATTWDAVTEVWINGLLSSPKTHIVNVASNSLVLAQQILERGIAEKLATLVRSGDALPTGVAPGEAAAMMYGLIAAQKDAWKASWLALKSGETGHALGKIDVPNQHAVTAEAFRIENDAAAKTVDFLGTVARVPSRLLGAEDEFFKTIAYRMEVGAQAVRQATSEGLQGPELRARVADLISSPPETIRLQAADAALYATFTQNAGDAAQALLKLREAWPATMYVLPFVRTPINIMAYGFERTPLAPMMAGFRADVAAGGARAQLALVKMGAGTSIMLAAADYADRGLITGQGPKEPGKREALMRQGWQPYSVRVGDKWVAYDRADPYGLLFGFAADISETVNRMEVDGDKLDEASELLAAGITAIASTTVNKTYLRGLADLMWTIEDPNRKAFGYVGSTMGSFVPAGVNAMKSIGDPVLRENFKAWDYVQGRLPGWTAGMVPARDLWGKERQPDSGLGVAWDTLSPLRATAMKVSPIDTEMQRLNMDVERIDKKSMVMGVAMNFRDFPEVYDRYVVLAGNELKHPAYGDLGARDYLDALVTGKHGLSDTYNTGGNGPEGGKAAMIKATILEYRKMAQAAILADPSFALFQAAWREQRDVQNERRSKLEGLAPVKTPNIPMPMPPGAQPVAPPAGISPMRAP